jgi:hypothetical protein
LIYWSERGDLNSRPPSPPGSDDEPKYHAFLLEFAVKQRRSYGAIFEDAVREHAARKKRRQDQPCRDLIATRHVAFDEIKDRRRDERGELKVRQSAREAGQPFDLERLQELRGEPDDTATTGWEDRFLDHMRSQQEARARKKRA